MRFFKKTNKQPKPAELTEDQEKLLEYLEGVTLEITDEEWLLIMGEDESEN